MATEVSIPTDDPDLAALLGQKKKTRWWLIGLVLLPVLGCAGLVTGLVIKATNRPGYETAAVEAHDLETVVSVTGSLEGRDTVEVGSEVSGKILKLGADDDDTVTKDEILAEIDPEQLDASLAQSDAQVLAAEASVSTAQATSREASNTLHRITSQHGTGLVSDQDLESAKAAASRADAQVKSARANLVLARAQRDQAASRREKATIRSPLDGVVLSRLVEEGQTVTAGFTTPVLFRLARDLSTMTLTVDIDESDVGRVKAGQEATFTVEAWPDQVFPSKVVRLHNDPTTTSGVVTYEAELEVSNPKGLLRPGMTANATITTAHLKDAPTVPWSALRFAPEGAKTQSGRTLWTLENGKPTPVPVTLGANDVERVEVHGIALGTPVIVGTSE
jgi:HlyD family secretion protein